MFDKAIYDNTETLCVDKFERFNENVSLFFYTLQIRYYEK